MIPLPFIALGVVVVVVALLIGGVFKKKAAAPASHLSTKPPTRQAARQTAKPDHAPAPSRTPGATRPAARTRTPGRERVARVLQDARQRTAAPTAARDAKGAGARTRSTKRGPEETQVTALSDGSALIGSRTVHSGDIVSGCIIRDITSDFVRVEKDGAVFTLTVGSQLP